MDIQSHTVFMRSFIRPFSKNGLEKINYLPPNIDDDEEDAQIENDALLIPRSPPTFPALQRENSVETVPKSSSGEKEFFLHRTKRILVRISSVFPFDFFPSTVEIEDNKVTVTHRQFFACSQIFSIDMHDISNIFVETAPFFATLKIITRSFVENNIKIPWLKRSDALHARNIIEGLRIFSQEKIDTSKYELDRKS